jgi:hypothetical protein
MRHICDAAGQWLAGARRRRGAPNPQPNLPPVTTADAATVFARTPTVIAVLANDSDPEGGPLTVAAATAAEGEVEIRPDGTLLYISSPGFTGIDTVTYAARDAQGAEAQGTLTVTVAGPLLSLSPNAEGTLTVAAANGEITVTVTEPAAFAGTYVSDTALLSGGPVAIIPPRIAGQAQTGVELTAVTGLWIFEGEVTGETWSWRRNGAPIAGATAATYTVSQADEGAALTVAQTLTAGGGNRTSTSPALAIPLTFVPSADAGLVAWWDASATSTIARSGTTLTSWVARAGTGTLTGASGPTSGTRAIAGQNVVDFAGSARVSGAVTLPPDGNVAFHMVVAIDSVANAFASLISANATRDFQLEANNATLFSGRMNVRNIGEAYNLAGGPWAGLRLVSVLFDRTGTGTMRVLIGGTEVGAGAYSTALDSAATLALMTNRNQNAYVDGAVCEVVVTGNLAATANHAAYLSAKWGIA